MNIYKIHHDDFEYDSYMAHVIVAFGRIQVRQIAQNKTDGAEGKEAWQDAKIEYLGEYNGEATEPFIVLSDFRAG